MARRKAAGWFKVPFKPVRSTRTTGMRRTQIKEPEALPYLGPHTSISEQRLAAELTRRKIRFEFQIEFRGGRSTRGGGMVVDFLLPETRTIIRVQGAYWHSRPGSQSKDDSQSIYLRSKGYTVIDIFDLDINNNVRAALDRALGVWR
jgi:very-short-patch-repair endonuclease